MTSKQKALIQPKPVLFYIVFIVGTRKIASFLREAKSMPALLKINRG
jgi:hypothetical protein